MNRNIFFAAIALVVYLVDPTPYRLLSVFVTGVASYYFYTRLYPSKPKPAPKPTPPLTVNPNPVKVTKYAPDYIFQRNKETEGRVLLGVSDNGEEAIWNIEEAQQIGIFGANGTGKSASVACNLIFSMLLWEWHVIILDPKRGADYSHFRGLAEYHFSGAEEMYDQIMAIAKEVERRAQLLTAHEVGNISALPANLRPKMFALVIEELGDTRASLAIQDPMLLAKFDNALSRLFQKSRYTGLVIVLIDQKPADYPKVIKGNLKEIASFVLGMHQGSGIGMPATQNLKPRGEFMLRSFYGPKFNATDVLVFTIKLMDKAIARLGITRAEMKRKDYYFTLSGEMVEFIIKPFEKEEVPTAPSVFTNTPVINTAATVVTGVKERAFELLSENPGLSYVELSELLHISKPYANKLIREFIKR